VIALRGIRRGDGNRIEVGDRRDPGTSIATPIGLDMALLLQA